MAANKLDSSMLEDATVTDAKLANGAVTNTKLATGIDATKLADGTITNSELQYINTLSSNAQTQISGAGGAYKVVASGSLSNVTEFVYTNLTKTTTFHFEDVLGTVQNHGLNLRYSTDNGNTFDTASNYGRVKNRVDASHQTWTAATSDIPYITLYSPCSTSNSFRVSCTIFNPAGTQYTKMRSQGEGIEGNNQETMSLYSVGVHKVAGAVNAAKFYISSGNFTATYVVTEFN